MFKGDKLGQNKLIKIKIKKVTKRKEKENYVRKIVVERR